MVLTDEKVTVVLQQMMVEVIGYVCTVPLLKREDASGEKSELLIPRSTGPGFSFGFLFVPRLFCFTRTYVLHLSFHSLFASNL